VAWVLAPARHLNGCLDMDLEASAMTKRAARAADGPAVGAQQAAPAVYVRAVSLAVERLEQIYMRAAHEASGQRYDYAAPLRVRLRGPFGLRRVWLGARLPRDRRPCRLIGLR